MAATIGFNWFAIARQGILVKDFSITSFSRSFEGVNQVDGLNANAVRAGQSFCAFASRFAVR